MTLTPATIRFDLKCGKGAISEGEKCTKGAAQRVQPKKGKKTRSSSAKKALLIGATIGGAALLGTGLELRSQRKLALRGIKRARASGNAMLVNARKSAKNFNKKYPNNPGVQRESDANIMLAKTVREIVRKKAKQGIDKLKTEVPKSPARRRAAQRSKQRASLERMYLARSAERPPGLDSETSDSIYADGFFLEPGQLAI